MKRNERCESEEKNKQTPSMVSIILATSTVTNGSQTDGRRI